MRIALLSDANTPGPYHHVLPPGTDGWQINSVEALAWALTADVWHGTVADETVCNTFAERYDLLLVNMKHTLWRSLPVLRRALKGMRIIGYQEGPTDLIAHLDDAQLEGYLNALKALDGFLCYDARGEALHQALLGALPVATLPLPAPMKVYDRVRIPYEERPNDPPWIGIAHPVSRGRGSYVSICVASEIQGARIVLEGSSSSEVGRVSRFIAEKGCIPDVHSWLPWVTDRIWGDRINILLRVCPHCGSRLKRPAKRASFLRRYAQCRFAVSLDPQMCYGRFAVDCAGLEIPLICSQRIVAGETIWPRSSFDDIQTAIGMMNYWQEYPDQPITVAKEARKRLQACTDIAVRDQFHTIMEEWGDESAPDDQPE